MPPRPKALAHTMDSTCAITRTLSVLSDRWSFLILREAFSGVSKFADFKASLGIASDVLSARLAALVEFGVLEKVPYHEPGKRTRSAYRLTPAGQELKIVIAGLQQWGDDHLPRPEKPTIARLARDTCRPLRVSFVDDTGQVIEQDDAEFVRTETYPTSAIIDR